MNVEPEHEPPPPYTDRNESLLNTVALSTAAAPLAVSQRSTDSRTELPNESLSAAPHSPPQNHSSQTDCPQNGQVAVGSHGPPSVRRIPSRYHVATSTARNQRSLSSSSNFASSSGSGAFVSHLDAVPATSPTGTGPHVSPPNGHRGTVKSLLAVPLPDCLNLLHGVLGFTQCSLRGLIKVSLAKPVAADSISLKVRLVGVERAYLVGSVNGSSSAGSTSIPALSDADREFGLGELIWSEPRINSSDTSGAWAKFSSKFRLSPSSPSHSPHGSAPVRERNYCSFPHLSPSKNAAVVYERTISVSVPRPEEGTVTLEAGDYEYPFLFDPLPDWLPGTFHGSQSSLVYTLEVVLNATTAISKAVATKRTDPAPSQDRTSDDRIQLQAYTSLEVPIPRFHTSLFKTPVPNGTSYPREKHNYIPATSPQTEKSNARTNNHAIEINFPPAEAGESIPWSPNGGVSLNGHTVPSPTYTAEITVQPPHSPVAAFRDDSTVISNHQTESPIRFTCLLNTRTVRFEKGVQILIHLSKVMPGYHIVGVEASIVQVLEVRRWTGSSQQSLGTPPQSKSNRNSFGAPSLSHKIYESVLGITADSPKCSADYFNKTIFIPCSRTRDAIPTMGEDEEIFPVVDNGFVDTSTNSDGLTGDSGALSGLGIEGVGLEDDGVPSANPRRKVLRTMTTVRHEIRLTWRTTYSAAPASASFSMSEATSPPSPRPQSPLSLPSPILFNHKPIKASGGSGGGVIAAANGGSPVATPWKRELAVEAFRAPIVVHGLSDEMIEIIEGFLSDESVEGGWRSRLQRVQFVAKR
ncbi:hypothetical protein DFJ73DRAFT_852051 [Zopfochytrium polystomum]|nr:hypothetical protein DFJ73DRAFT_852051 [Zopfochytrium polystomum]